MKLEGVWKSYEGRTVLRDLSLTLPQQGYCCVLGPSGAGKTTLLRLLAGLDRPDRGTVDCPGRVSMVFQEDRLLPRDTVLDNVALVSDRETGARLLTALGLGQWLHHRPGELSGGMRRRVAIARALALPAEVYLMDEPLKGLDADTRRRVWQVIRQETADGLLVMVTHERADALGADVVVTVDTVE